MNEEGSGDQWQDSVVAEVRAARQAIWIDVGGEVESLARRLRDEQAASGRTVVSFPPRPAESGTAAA